MQALLTGFYSSIGHYGALSDIWQSKHRVPAVCFALISAHSNATDVSYLEICPHI